MDAPEFHGYRIHWVHGQSSPQLRAQIIAFWREQGALSDPYEAWRRTFEVASVTVDQAGRIAGVSSVYSEPCAQLGAPYWFYRTFVRPDVRSLGLAERIFHFSVARLAESYAGEPGAPVGVILVIENPGFETAEGQRALQGGGLARLGVDSAGRSVWYRQFAAPTPSEHT